ncbi:MAG: VWA domain-containing protein [bacterium]|nr:VWA domain-containing protein [bacterium]
MTFTAPLALVFLIVLPLVLWIGRPRLTYRRGRDLSSLALRVIILTLVILALAGTQSVRAADRLAVVFVVDSSDSMGAEAAAAQETYIRDALAAMRPDDQAAVVSFGGNALVERAMSSVRELGAIRSTPNTGNSDLEEAINLGLALFPAGTARRLVILSDGLPTVGDAERAAQRAAALGVEISYVQFERDPVPDVAVTDVLLPPSVGAGQSFDLSLTVESETDTPAVITVEAGGITLSRESVTLAQGVNRYTLPLTAGEAGFRDFRVIVTPSQGDGFYQNNQLSAFSRVVGAPRLLVVSRDAAVPVTGGADATESGYLRDALTALGFEIDVRPPDALPIGVAALEAYDAVVLVNIPATLLSTRRMEALQTYVRDLGGGLVVIGGAETYAPGGYFRTPLEATLPVEMQLRDQQRIPQLTLAYVVDRSGSMAMIGSSGVENIELAKEALLRSIEFLQPTDRAGVVGFDSQAYWVADVQPVLDRFTLQALIGSLQPGGGTDIMAGMRLAADVMRAETSERKHIILLTDGGANDRGLVDLVAALNQDDDVTTSVIAIGGQNPGFLEEMAQAGEGNYHVAQSIESIPTIFAQETVLATRSYLIEGAFTPARADLGFLQNFTAAPPLYGYVATTPKDTAQVLLVTPDAFADPLLAAWQYGLGRAVAFTSDATARWARDWVAWDGFADFWNQTVRWSIIEGTDANLETRVILEGETARIVVDARADDGAFLNGLALDASLIDPALGVDNLTLQQVAPGRYEAAFRPGAEGAYLISVAAVNAADESAAESPFRQTAGWVLSYSPEYALRTAGRESILPALAAVTDGRSLAGSPALAFDHNLMAGEAVTPLAPILLLIAALLLPVDVAVRRLVITRSDLARVRAAFGRRQPADVSETVSSLQAAKQRAQARTQEQAQVTVNAAAPGAAGITPTDSLPDSPASAIPAAAPTPPLPDYGDAGNLAGKLLQKRRPRDENHP